MKTAIVTGGTKGIGAAIVEMLLADGYKVITTYGSDDGAARKFVQSRPEYSVGQLIVEKVNQEDMAQIAHFTDKLKLYGRIDCLICNAGATLRKNIDAITNEDWERIMMVNVNSNLYLVRDLFNELSSNARIIFIGSLMGIYPHGTSLAYGVSKSAVHALAKNLVKFFEGTGTTVNTIAPGFVETEWQKDKPEQIRKNIYAKTAQKRFATVYEIVSAVKFCIGNAFVNGAIIEISGGYCYK